MRRIERILRRRSVIIAVVVEEGARRPCRACRRAMRRLHLRARLCRRPLGWASVLGWGSPGWGVMGDGQAANNNNPLFRSQTPAPPALVPPKPRRLSLSGGSPPRSLARSTSEEKAEAFVRWLPPSLNVGGEYDAHVKRSVSRVGR